MDVKNIQDIIPDREIIKMKNDELFGIEYETWNVSLPIFCDTVEKLLENGFMVSFLEDNHITVSRQINTSPEILQTNKAFWRKLTEVIDQ